MIKMTNKRFGALAVTAALGLGAIAVPATAVASPDAHHAKAGQQDRSPSKDRSSRDKRNHDKRSKDNRSVDRQSRDMTNR